MLLTVLGVVFVALGVAIGWYGLRRLAVVPRVLRSDVVDPDAVTDEDSFVVCRGIATESTEGLSAPFTGSPCLGVEFEVTEKQPFGITLPWVQAHLDDGVATRPFTLDGPNGSVNVRPSPKRFGLDTESTVITVGADETPPDRIRQFVDVREELEPVADWIRILPGFGTRRYVERRIDPGEEYLVAGPTERRQGEVALNGNLVVTDRSPRRFATERLRDAVFPLSVGLIFIGVGLFGIVT
ncbi:hypothetical protein ACFQAS_04850 [Halopenitus salinus]|jgi:hypothetical protein|uniref:RING-type E3 ubiquitin transferase n=1 Tax=Halopenitus salinus TaxID=1198295 RepID=A0ABD5UW54_9EURY